ncbi:hypothetical protein BSLG_003161 [Batrachochytrium salamandrivorans]|nr:hypothetical protein BSLG_003161 [Batrachochytrium salamandrivorans]
MDTWDINQVTAWISSLGLKRHEQIFRENNITGDILVHADHEMLKELEICAIGQRIALLKAIYNLKVLHGIPFDEDDYIPETVISSTTHACLDDRSYFPGRRQMLVSGEASHLEAIIKEQGKTRNYAFLHCNSFQSDMILIALILALTIERLNAEMTTLNADLCSLKDSLRPVWALLSDCKASQQKKEADAEEKSYDIHQSPYSPIVIMANNSTFGALSSNTDASLSDLAVNPISLASLSRYLTVENEIPEDGASITSTSAADITLSTLANCEKESGTIRVYGDRLPDRDSESYKSFRVYMDDSCSKLIPDVVAKYKLPESWKHYALFIQCRGKERCLSYNECPMALVNQMKDCNYTLEFSIRHIRKIKRPISCFPLVDLDSIYPQYNSSMLLYASHPTDSTFIHASSSPSSEIAVLVGYAIYESVSQSQNEHDPMKCQQDATASFRLGTALYGYEKTSPNEVCISKGNTVIIHHEYEHWLLVECNLKKGWVPSCYVSVMKDNGLGSQSDLGSVSQRTVEKSVQQSSTDEAPSTDIDLPSTRLASTINPISPTKVESKLVLIQAFDTGETLALNCKETCTDSIGSIDIQADVEAIEPSQKHHVDHSSALAKLSSLLDIINPYMDDSGANVSVPSRSESTSDTETKSYSHATTKKMGSGLDLDAPQRSPSVVQDCAQAHMHVKVSIEELAYLGQLLNQTGSTLAEYQVEAGVNAANIPSNNGNLERFIAAHDMVTVLGEKLGVHGSHIISKSVYGSIILVLDDLVNSIRKSLADLRLHAASHVSSALFNQPPNQAAQVRVSNERDEIIQDSIDYTHNSLIRVVGLLLEDARMCQYFETPSLTQDEAAQSEAFVSKKKVILTQGAPDSTLSSSTSAPAMGNPTLYYEAMPSFSSKDSQHPHTWDRTAKFQQERLRKGQTSYIARPSCVIDYDGGVNPLFRLNSFPKCNLDESSDTKRDKGADLLKDQNVADFSNTVVLPNFQDLHTANPYIPEHEHSVFPYNVVLQRKDLDQNNLEKYLSNEDCIKYLGHAKTDLVKLPEWKLGHLKRRAGLAA